MRIMSLKKQKDAERRTCLDILSEKELWPNALVWLHHVSEGIPTLMLLMCSDSAEEETRHQTGRIPKWSASGMYGHSIARDKLCKPKLCLR